MTNTGTGSAIQVIKAATADTFLAELNAMSSKVTNRAMAYLGLCNEGAVLDTVPNSDSVMGLKVGEKLELACSPETLACAPCYIKSIHWAGNNIICNASENLFTYPQAEKIIRGVAAFLKTTGANDVILGGNPTGCGSWLLPEKGAPVCLSTFGWASVLPYQNYYICRDTVSGGCYCLNPDNIQRGNYGRQYWTRFYTPTAGVMVANFGHRIRDHHLYVTLRTGMNTSVEVWDLRPILNNKPVTTTAINMKPEWKMTWGTEIVGPCETGNTLAIASNNTTGITFYGVQA